MPVDDIPDSAKLDAIDILTTYVDFIRNEVRADDFERHTYVPHIEQTIEDLRAAPQNKTQRVSYCDCEKSHNGLGLAGRECDCAARPAMDREAVEANWLRGDWYERWQDATENADDELMATLESLRGRVERTILAALSLSADAIRQGEGDTLALKRRADREEAAHLLTIGQRDAAEHALSDAYRAVCGREPQWSNNFGYEDAVREMCEAATPASHASDGGKA